ncbi:sucrose-phosphatase 1-like isoform X3 [Apium graveolens]|uniref:sucrose-phosphatase 1-like isoform X3 n=1 Tax=Apium graveolens TaxID=4045 RepID=UPI003D78C49B
MDRLHGPARLMIVSDLDQTMVDHNDCENLSLLRFNALWEAEYRQDSLLVFSSGRSFISYEHLRDKKPLLSPDITVMSVGTEIAYGESMVPDDDWKQSLDKNWNRDIVLEETSKFPELTPQLDAKTIYSGGEALDVLPEGAGKGRALSYLLNKFKVEGKRPNNILVCGDSGNDAELFSVPEVHGVMVSNAMEELLQWREENAKSNSKILLATERGAAGIIQAIGNFGLGSSISPRDRVDLSEFGSKTLHPDHEIVMFYLFYEKWRKAEVEKTEQSLHKLKSLCHSMAIFVHPSGVKRPLKHSIDDVVMLHGDKKGKPFSVWVDQVYSAEIASNTWLVKFYKWELCDEEKYCCLTTVLLSLKTEEPDGLMWLHMHQTWLEGRGTKESSTWLL